MCKRKTLFDINFMKLYNLMSIDNHSETSFDFTESSSVAIIIT